MAFDFKHDFRRAASYLMVYVYRLQADDAQWRSARSERTQVEGRFLAPEILNAFRGLFHARQQIRRGVPGVTTEYFERILSSEAFQQSLTESMLDFDEMARHESDLFLQSEESEAELKRALTSVQDFVEEASVSSDIEGAKFLEKITRSLSRTHENLLATDELCRIVDDITSVLHVEIKRAEREQTGERFFPPRNSRK